jgi:hypothetical protein
MQSQNLIDPASPEYQSKIKTSLLDIAQSITQAAGNGRPVNPHQLQNYMSVLQSLLPQKRTISDEVREWALTTGGNWLTTDLHRDLGLATVNHKKAATMAILRLVEEGILAKCGMKRGCYRLIEGDAPRMRLKDVGKMGQEVSINWPFGIENYFRALPKNLIVVAGEKDSGKSAFLLNLAAMNIESEMDIFYFSSEMGLGEMVDRIQKFDDLDLELWDKKIQMFERSDNFPDVIRPDAINLIDFLEISDNFYLINDRLKEIWQKLRKGIAIIALQKVGGTDYGRGGAFSAEKARLYLSLTSRANQKKSSICKIVAVKNWRDTHINPAGKTWDYILAKGCKFIEVGPDYIRPNTVAKPLEGGFNGPLPF